MPLKYNSSAGNKGVFPRQQTHYRVNGDAFAAAGLSYDSQYFTLSNGETYPPDSLYVASIGMEAYREIFQSQQILGCRHRASSYLLIFGSRASRRPSLRKLKATIVRLMAIAGKNS